MQEAYCCLRSFSFLFLWLAMTSHKPISLTARLAVYPDL